jgi:S-DNA-T family DNA segregation ATPase FtsK/SpoIIIE
MWGATSRRIRNEPGTITLRNPSIKPDLWLVVLGLAATGLGECLVAVIRRPVLGLFWLDATGLAVVGYLVGPYWFALGLAVAAGVLAAWRWRDRFRFDRWVWWPVRAHLRWFFVYRRWWQPAMTTTGLVEAFDYKKFTPALRGVASFGSTDVVRLRMLPGQVRDDYIEQAPRLARTFGAYDCRVKPATRADEVELWMLRTEDGRWWLLKLIGNHVLIAGQTGSGKSTVVQGLLQALTPALARGTVSVWCIDPKGGMEFGPSRAVFDRFAAGEERSDGTSYEATFADVLEDAVAVMRARQAVLGDQKDRLHRPTVADPLVMVLVDELASLTAYVTDRTIKNRIAAALKLLLSQGRASGVVVVASLQDPGKDVIPFRGLFTIRICLRVAEAVEVDMVVGTGAHARGALCETIPASQPGVGYVMEDGQPDPVRVRFPNVTDHDIQHLLHQLTIRDQASGCWDDPPPSSPAWVS